MAAAAMMMYFFIFLLVLLVLCLVTFRFTPRWAYTSLIRRLLENLPQNLKLIFRGWRNQSWAFRFRKSGLGSGQPFASR